MFSYLNVINESKNCVNCVERHGCQFVKNEYGYCCYYIIKDGKALIFNLYIEKEYRRKGHAEKILKKVIKKIRDSGYTKDIHIQAEPKDGSISKEDLVNFYKKLELVVE